MSTIHVLPRAANQAKLRTDARQPKPQNADQSHGADQEMMYAWSLGVTTAQERDPSEVPAETCPPEVYIG